jgi:hypothetical protein
MLGIRQGCRRLPFVVVVVLSVPQQGFDCNLCLTRLLNLLAELLLGAEDGVLGGHAAVEGALQLGTEGQLAHVVGLFLAEHDTLRSQGLVLHALEARSNLANLCRGGVRRLDSRCERGRNAVGAVADRSAVLSGGSVSGHDALRLCRIEQKDGRRRWTDRYVGRKLPRRNQRKRRRRGSKQAMPVASIRKEEKEKVDENHGWPGKRWVRRESSMTKRDGAGVKRVLDEETKRGC